jgi:tRNA-2-methylthio-N6-dimethylallyladenosine synthase
MPTFVVKTFGCQFNELYSASVADMLERAGLEQSTVLDQASLVVINTCAVREKAEEKAFSFLGEAARAVDASRIIFMGCSATLDQERAKRIAGRELNIIPGTAGVEEVLARVQSVAACVQSDLAAPRSLFPTADIEVVRGCESECTYCIVPRARGRETVVDAGVILREAEESIQHGFRELLLLGQNINRYHWNGGGLIDLLSVIDRLNGDFWFWFLSPHPAYFRRTEVECFMQLNHAERHVHLPLQSGSDSILRRMNRRYSMADYDALARAVRSGQGWRLTTDIIVGFPGETDEDFEATVAAVHRYQFDEVFLAKYSDRPGTPSSTMRDKVPRKTIDERHSALLRVVQDLSLRSNAGMAGRSVDVLVVKAAALGMTFGKSRDGRNVWFDNQTGMSLRPGSFVRVTVDHGSREGLYGVCID